MRKFSYLVKELVKDDKHMLINGISRISGGVGTILANYGIEVPNQENVALGLNNALIGLEMVAQAHGISIEKLMSEIEQGSTKKKA